MHTCLRWIQWGIPCCVLTLNSPGFSTDLILGDKAEKVRRDCRVSLLDIGSTHTLPPKKILRNCRVHCMSESSYSDSGISCGERIKLFHLASALQSSNINIHAVLSRSVKPIQLRVSIYSTGIEFLSRTMVPERPCMISVKMKVWFQPQRTKPRTGFLTNNPSNRYIVCLMSCYVLVIVKKWQYCSLQVFPCR